MKLGILILGAGLLLLYSHPLNWIGSATTDYLHTILIGFILICIGLTIIIRKTRLQQLVVKK
jgi:hypothetical protein